MSTEDTSASRPRFPWRSARAGWAAFVVIVAVGLPLYLRMPLWIDVTLYDVAARTVLSGGTHYKDVFDTNPPGFVWLLCGVRSLLGTSIEAVRAVDVVVVSGIAFLLLRAARRAGADPPAVAWGAAGMAGFYLFISEFNHAQRDVWMMLPALVATGYRVRRVTAVRERPVTNLWVFGSAAVEGLVWGVAVWIKPHAFPVAVAVWAVVLARWGTWRRAAADLLGVVLGGLAAGAAGVGWLVATGTWPHFYDVFVNWNTTYVHQMGSELGERFEYQLGYFPAWSLFVVLSVPVAVLNLLDARPWRRSPAPTGLAARWLPGWVYAPSADADARAARGVLAALYLSWLLTALLFQKRFHYVHVPETLLMIAVFAANRWAVSALVLALQAAVIAWVAAGPALTGRPVPEWEWEGVAFRHVVWTYPDRDPNRLKWWTACLSPTTSVPGRVRNGVAFQSDFFAGIDSAEIEEVADFLRAQHVREGEVMAWNDSPHAVYLVLGHRPPIRFMHLSTAVGMGERQYEMVRAEVSRAAPGIRYVISDLRRLSLFYSQEDRQRVGEPGPSPTDHLPPVVEMAERNVFPLNQPTVFRSGGGRGRYVVHALVCPIDDLYEP